MTDTGSKESKASAKSGGARNSQRMSLFQRARMSFVRSGGQRGATIENLRGTTGADFEGVCDVERGHSASLATCGCFGSNRGGSDSNVTVLVKGPFCFVYKEGDNKSPKYAINLAHVTATTKDSSHGKTAVWLETALGDVEYELALSSPEDAEKFCAAVTQQAAAGQAEMVRKRLGHGSLVAKRASIRYAESVATKKVGDQPEAPLSAEEMLSSLPVEGL